MKTDWGERKIVIKWLNIVENQIYQIDLKFLVWGWGKSVDEMKSRVGNDG